MSAPFDRAKEYERRIAQKTSRCIHFNGTQHGTCEAGVAYDSVRHPEGGIPCIADFNKHGATCDRLRLTTREEAEAETKAADEAFQRINTCLKAIRAKHGKARGLVDSMPCPNGCGGTLRYSIANNNGHVHGSCSTPNCASWMQ